MYLNVIIRLIILHYDPYDNTNFQKLLLRNHESKRNSFLQGRAPEMVIQYLMASPENICIKVTNGLGRFYLCI